MIKLVKLVFIITLAGSCGRAELALETKQITSGPKHHFFGYIGHVRNIPWNESERYLVALQTDYQDHLPTGNEAAEIVLLDVQHDFAVRVLDRTRAWNPQQGTMLYWNPEAPETQFFFNDRDPKTGKLFTVLFDVAAAGGHGKRIKEYRFDDTPVANSGVAQRGGWFAAINYARLARLRPVTGYRGAFDWTAGIRHPTNDGVFKINMRTGEKQLLVSFQQLAKAVRSVRPDVQDKDLFINHTLCNRENDRIFFFVRGDFDHSDRINQPFMIRPDGSGLMMMKQHIGGHPEWDQGHRMIGTVSKQQILYDTDRQELAGVLGTPEIFPDPEGDIALSPDARWLANGHRAKSTDYYTLYHRLDSAWIRSEGFDVKGWTSGDLRCDPAPCWNRQSTELVFPAIAKDGTRQMFLIRLKTGRN